MYPPGDALLLCVSIPGENLSFRLKIQFAGNSILSDGQSVRINFVEMLERLEMIDESAEPPIIPTLPPFTQGEAPLARNETVRAVLDSIGSVNRLIFVY